MYSPEGMASTSSSPCSSPNLFDDVSSTSELGNQNKNGTVATKHPVQVARRNARERKRVQQVNVGFVTLRNHIPVGQRNKKLSKVETLRQAAVYIAELRRMLSNDSDMNLNESIKQDASTKFCYPPQMPSNPFPYYNPMENYEPNGQSIPIQSQFSTVPSMSSYYPSPPYYCPPLQRIPPPKMGNPCNNNNNSSTSPDSSYISENSSYADLALSPLQMENSKIFQSLPTSEIELYMQS